MRRIIPLALLAILNATAIVTGSPADAATYKLVYSFQGSPDGANPETPLINVGGMLYGTTSVGGSAKTGTVFSLNPVTGRERVVYAFKGTRSTDGRNPIANLLIVGGILYGTTFYGGTLTDGGTSVGGGTVFAVDPATGAETLIHSFGASADGAFPLSGLTYVLGKVYGTTSEGGICDCDVDGGLGTIYAVDLKTNVETVVHSFKGAKPGMDGGFPDVTNLLNIGGTLYGSTAQGGDPAYCSPNGCGTLFTLALRTGVEKVVHDFAGGTEGSGSAGSLLNVGGIVYGLFPNAGNKYSGIVVSLVPATGALKVIYTFQGGTDGAYPTNLIYVAGKLYGTTAGGGRACHKIDNACGTVFVVDPATGAESLLYAFKGGTDGRLPNGLVKVGGTLYGTTYEGGAHGYGTVFAITP